MKGRVISDDEKRAHRDEIATFSTMVAGAEVEFAAASYRAWLSGNMEKAASEHARRLLECFEP